MVGAWAFSLDEDLVMAQVNHLALQLTVRLYVAEGQFSLCWYSMP